MDRNVTAVVQSRENNVNTVDENGVGTWSAKAASERNILWGKKSLDWNLGREAVEIEKREAAREAVVAESGGVGGGGLSHGDSEKRGVGRGEEGEGGVGGGGKEIEIEVGSGYGIGEEIVALSSDNGEHCVELLRRNGRDEGGFG